MGSGLRRNDGLEWDGNGCFRGHSHYIPCYDLLSPTSGYALHHTRELGLPDIAHTAFMELGDAQARSSGCKKCTIAPRLLRLVERPIGRFDQVLRRAAGRWDDARYPDAHADGPMV